MKRASGKLAAVRKRLPRGRRLPTEFPAFIKLVTSEKGPRADVLRVGTSDPANLLNVTKEAAAHVVPFITLGDGGIIGLWYRDGDPCVVHHDSEGAHRILAHTFHDFLRMLAAPSPSFRERVELDVPLDTSALVSSQKPKRVTTAHNRKLTEWLEQHSLSAKPQRSPTSQRLRRQLVAIARRMLADGLSRVNKPRDFYWSMNLRLVKRAGRWQVTYLDYGQWYPLPAKYGLLALLPDLLSLMKNPRKPRYELNIVKTGFVFADGGNQLSLEP